MIKEHGRLRHLELLVTMIVMLVIQSFLAPDSLIKRTTFNLLILAVVLSAIRTLSDSRNRLAAAVTFGGVAYVLSWIVEFSPSTLLLAAEMACYVIVFTILVVALSESVFQAGPIDLNRIIGAASIYFVLGLVWAFTYAFLETVQPGSFRFHEALISDGLVQDKVSDLIYFSYVTLTTLGYGDITPVSRPARMFASLEAITGQLYIAIVISRMVGLHISQNVAERT